MIVICGITVLQIPAGNCLTHLFIYYQIFTVIDDLSMLHIKGVPNIINDHNLVPNQESHLSDIKHRKPQAIL